MEQKDYETLTCETQEFRGYSQGKTIVDQFYVDQDYNVPDAKSDVQRVILNEGTLRIEEQKIVDNYIRISGKIQFRMLYVTDDSEKRLSSLEGRFPFEELVYAEKVPEGSLFIKSSQTELTVTVIHSRKLGIKALVELQVCSEQQKEEHLTSDIYREGRRGEEGSEYADGLCRKKRQETLLKMHTMIHTGSKKKYRLVGQKKISAHYCGPKSLRENWTQGLGRKYFCCRVKCLCSVFMNRRMEGWTG